MANEHLGALPAGLSAADFTMGDSLLDYTPPNVQWQAPLIPLGENVFESFVKTHLDEPASWRLPSGETYTATPQTPWYPGLVGERLTGEPDLLKEYNRRLSRELGVPGSLPESSILPGQPESMAEFGERRFGELSDIDPEGTRLYPLAGEPPPLFSDIHQKPLRNPYLAYSGAGTAGMGGGVQGARGRLPQPSVEGYEYAYPVYPYGRALNEREIPGEFRYAPTGWDVGPQEAQYTRPRFTQDINQYPYFPYMPGDPFQQVGDEQFITVGQTLVPTGDYSGIFSL